MKHLIFPFLILLSSLVFSGCAHRPLPFKPDLVVERGIYQEIEECEAPDSCLQIFIMYQDIMCSHTALRLQTSEADAIFWDPAGGYGRKGSVKATRDNDLVVSPIPTVKDYMQFRKEMATEAVELFEFHISEARAKRLIGILRGELKEIQADDFKTITTGFFCSQAVSAFLERFAGDYLPVKKAFLPHNFAKQLYTIPADRIVIFEEDGNGGFLLSEPSNE